MTSPKQKIILDFATKNDNKISSSDALELIGHNYHNANKYVCEVLSRMVKSNLLKRTKKGFFEIKSKQTVENIINPNQMKLL